MVSPSTTNKQFIHGDFDKDGTPNIDDKYPFSKKKSGRVNPEVSLSKTIKYVERKRREARRVAKPFAKKEGMKFRVKGTYSAINKAVRTSPGVTNDFIGFRKEVKTRKEGRKRFDSFNKKHKVKDKDNKYKTLKGSKNPYRAFHSNFNLKGFGAEAQVRTKKFGKLNDEMHIAFKKGKSTKPFLKRSKKLINLGF